jgi:rubrerythrin
LSVEEWQREYDLIYQELNNYLAQELLESTKHDENFHIQKYEELNQQEVEHLTQMYNNPDNTNFYVCAVCKGYVHRLQNQPSRIVCERRGCIDIDLRID